MRLRREGTPQASHAEYQLCVAVLGTENCHSAKDAAAAFCLKIPPHAIASAPISWSVTDLHLHSCCCRLQDEDLEALRKQLAETQQTAEALRGSGVEARAQAQEYGQRARHAETLNQEQAADLASLR